MSVSYEAVIGLEVHIQLNTRSKAFCADRAEFSIDPNTQISAISLAHPGTLPRINRAQISSAIKLGLALKCMINQSTYFDRKHYFYADLPKGFQTTQDGKPICLGGQIDYLHQDTMKSCRVHHIHMEEDAGKSIHDLDDQFSFIDLNRAGVPLLELVTEPDFRHEDEVFSFIHELRRIVRYLEISDGNMEEGSLRCDCNVSVRPKGQESLNDRCEIKNINSARYAKKAIAYEIGRQIEIYDTGKQVSQDTLEFVPELGITRSLRGKEDAHDYRYFPEPDLPLIRISDAQIEQIRKTLPFLPTEWYDRFSSMGLSYADIQILTETRDFAKYFQGFTESHPGLNPTAVAKLLINWVRPYLEQHDLVIDHFPLDPEHLASFLTLLAEGKIINNIAYQKLWPALLEAPQDPAGLMQALSLDQATNQKDLKEIVVRVIDDCAPQVDKLRKGKKAVMGFLIGQVMRQTQGKADPDAVRRALEEALK